MFSAFLPTILIDRLGWLLVHSIWQFTLIAIAVWAILRVLKQASPNARYWTCLLGGTVMILAPVVTWEFLPQRHEDLDGMARRRSGPVDSGPSEFVPDSTTVVPPIKTPESVPVDSHQTTFSWVHLGEQIAPWLEELVVVWCLGVSIFGLRLGWGWYTAHRLRHRGLSKVSSTVTAALKRVSQKLGVRKTVQVRQSNLVGVPMVVGYLRPIILLPLCVVTGLTATQVEAILAHELAHVRRHDYLVNLLQTLMETVCFYHPAVWWLSSRLRHEREQCCDKLAVESLGSRADYGRALLALEELRGTPPVLSLGANGGSLLERIRRLAADKPSRPSVGFGGLFVLVSFLVVVGAVATWTATRAGEPTMPTTTVQISREASQESTSDSRQPAGAGAAAESGDQRRETGNKSNSESGVVEGVLIDAADGTPVAGARILLRASRLYDSESDGDGKFRLEGIPPNPRQYVIWAYVRNLVTPIVQLEQTISEESNSAEFAPVRLVMREGKKTNFLVTSAVTGQPLGGAVIRFGYPDRRKTETTADGMAVVEGLLAKEYDVTIESEGHAREELQIDLVPVTVSAEYKAELDPGGVVLGIAVDEQGRPVSGANVVYRIDNGTGFYGDAYRTDSDGRFQNRFLPFDTPIELTVRADDYELSKQEILLSTENRELDIQVTLKQRPSGGSVAGVVRDADENPVQGVTIATLNGRSDDRREVLTDAQGSFVLHDLLKNYTGYNIYVSGKGFAPQRIAVEPGTAEAPAQVTVNLEVGRKIRGQIVDENAQPLSGAFFSPRSPAFGPIGMGKTVRTGDDGQFELDSLPADVRFDVSHTDYSGLRGEALQLDGGAPITVRLEAPGVLRGRVIDSETKQPIPQFRVRLGFTRSHEPGDPKGSYNSTWGNPGITFNSPEGDFLIKPLNNGLPLEMIVLAEGYQRSVIPRVVAATIDHSEPVSVSLKRADESMRSTLTGQLLDYRGEPAADAQLRLIVSTDQPTGPDDGNFNWSLIKNGQLGQKSYCEQFISATTDRDGRFEFKDILPNKYLQLAYWGEGVPQGRSLAFDETQPGAIDPVTIQLPQPAEILGTIERARFPEAGTIRLSRDRSAWHIYEIKLGEDQTTFAFNDLPPGDYTVYVAAKPVEFTENGQTMFRISTLAQQRSQLQAGQVKEITFAEPNVDNP